MRPSVKASSWIAAAVSWVLLSALVIFIITGFRDRAALIRDNTNERLINTLLTSLRNYDDFGTAIESSEALKGRIKGFAIYGSDMRAMYEWGETPATLDERALEDTNKRPWAGRYTIPDPKSRSITFILRPGMPAPITPGRFQQRNNDERMPRPPDIRPPEPPAKLPPDIRSPDARQQRNPGMIIFEGNTRYMNFMGDFFYISISQPDYWRTMTITTLLLPLCVVLLAVVIWYVRNLYMRNREYRERIESQKNLVVLGTAASTLAHEIKNPLSSIRLQTGILGKLYTERGGEELTIINEEVDRLSELTYRVNDYLREGKGNPSVVNISNLAAETGRRLCGRNIMAAAPVENALVFADPERLRSVLENLIRNALESGSAVEDISITVEQPEGTITIGVYDRGRGIAEDDLERIFDPFFTRKSTGTGIGLSISRRFVEAAGGNIHLQNRKDGGAGAIISLPQYKDDQK
jgi:two-component system sensor histidine kinase HydH